MLKLYHIPKAGDPAFPCALSPNEGLRLFLPPTLASLFQIRLSLLRHFVSKYYSYITNIVILCLFLSHPNSYMWHFNTSTHNNSGFVADTSRPVLADCTVTSPRKEALYSSCLYLRTFPFFFIMAVLIILFSFYLLDSFIWVIFSLRVSGIFTYASSPALKFPLRYVITIMHNKMTWPFCLTVSFCVYFTYEFAFGHEN